MQKTGFRYRRVAAFGGCVALCLAGAFFVGCGGGGHTDGNTSTGSLSNSPTTRSATVSVVGMNFGAPISVTSGTVVTWQNNSGLPHNIVWDSHSPDSAPGPGANIGTFQPNQSVTWTAPTVTESVTYQYHCGIHGPMMSSAITVTR